MQRIPDEEVQRRIDAWANVTLLSLELKQAALHAKYPRASDREISDMIRDEHVQYEKADNDR